MMTNRSPISPSGLAEQHRELDSELQPAIARVLASGWYVLGPEVTAFEQEFAAWLGGNVEGVGVASGTDALTLALRALDVGPGDEVIVPSNSLPTAYGVAATGCILRFCDARFDDYQLDLDDVAAAIGPRTRAVVAVHLYGHPVDVRSLRELIGDRDVAIIEDCAQAHGARAGDAMVGTAGDLAAFSFYPTKNLGAVGDGGMVVTGDPVLASRVRSLRMYGETRRYHSAEMGTNSRLDEIQAAILRIKLPHLHTWLDRRRAIARLYDERLSAVDCIVAPPAPPNFTQARHLYPVRVSDRDSVLSAMQAAGIAVAVHYPVGGHDQPCFSQFRDRALPVTETLGRELLSLPMHPFLSDTDVNFICDTLIAQTNRAISLA